MARARSGRRTDYTWSGAPLLINLIDLAVGAGGSQDAFTFNVAGTVTRTRGEVLLQLDPTAADERAVVAMGLIVASENAVAAGFASLPGPHTDASDDWFWHSYVTVTSLAEAGVVEGDGLFARVMIDSKAMRKVKASEHVVFVAEVANSVDAGGSLDLIGGIRLLLGT